jgi:hypothetical protein
MGRCWCLILVVEGCIPLTSSCSALSATCFTEVGLSYGVGIAAVWVAGWDVRGEAASRGAGLTSHGSC